MRVPFNTMLNFMDNHTHFNLNPYNDRNLKKI